MTGLEHALCALSFFRHRHGRDPRYKASKRPLAAQQTIGHHRRYCEMVRIHIRSARTKGFHGSIRKAVEERAQEKACSQHGAVRPEAS